MNLALPEGRRTRCFIFSVNSGEVLKTIVDMQKIIIIHTLSSPVQRKQFLKPLLIFTKTTSTTLNSSLYQCIRAATSQQKQCLAVIFYYSKPTILLKALSESPVSNFSRTNSRLLTLQQRYSTNADGYDTRFVRK